MFDILEVILALWGTRFSRIDGSTKIEDLQVVLTSLQKIHLTRSSYIQPSGRREVSRAGADADDRH